MIEFRFLHYFTPINQETFRRAIIKALGTNKDLYFGVMSDCYFAEYKPEYPENSSSDYMITCDWLNGKSKIYGNLQALIPTIIDFDNLGNLINYIESL